MNKKIDLTGQVINRLTVISFDKKIKDKPYWLCKCSCGNIKSINQCNLKSGKSKSCGCLRNEVGAARLKKLKRIKYDEGVGSCNFLWNRYKQGAKKRKIGFYLSQDEFQELTSQNCYYCNIEPKQYIIGHRSNGPYLYNGIDRIDSNDDYVDYNCVPCCEHCNRAKHLMTHDEFIDWIERAYTNMPSKRKY